jgi:uncharacterized membrane protein YdjX (TVP38/TMEM64 family)
MFQWRRVLGPLILLALVVSVAFVLSNLITPAHVESVTRGAGQLGPFMLGVLLLATQVFAPLSGTPLMLVGIKLYGYPTAMGILYASFLVSSVLNFWIARLYGRNLLIKVVGRKTVGTIDELSQLNERTLLISFRIFGYSFFDVISYALGLTTIEFKKYFFYTALLTSIPFAAQYFLFSRIDFNSFRGMLIYIVSIAAAGSICAALLYKVLRE